MSFQRLPRKRGEKVNFFFENLSLVPETSAPKEHFKLVFGSGTSDLAKIRPLKIWTSWISPWVPPYGILPRLAGWHCYGILHVSPSQIRPSVVPQKILRNSKTEKADTCDDGRKSSELRSLCVYLFTKKNSDEIVRYPRCIPPWNSMIATNSAIETSRST